MELFQLGILFLTLLPLVYVLYFRIQANSKGNTKLPPSPPTLPIIGNLHQLGQLPHQSLYELSKKHGSLMLLHLGSKPTLVVSSAKVAKEILKTHDLAFASKADLSVIKKLFYDMKDLIHLPYGDQWRKMRSIFVNQLLGATMVKSFFSIWDEEIALLMGNLKTSCLSSSPVNLSEKFKCLSNDWICRAAFGKKHNETRHGKAFLDVLYEGVGLIYNFTIGEFIPWLDWINNLNGYNAALDGCAKRVDDVINAIIDDHMQNRRENSNGQSFVDILIGIYEGNTPGVSIDITSLKAMIEDIFGGGTESSSTTLIWGMTELIRHPEVMKKLQDEIRGIMKEKQHIEETDLQNMHYLKAVIKETLRLHPPVGVYFHAARESVDLMGYSIPQGTMVLVNVWAIGRDPSFWHEPEKFMPDRFLNSSVDFKGTDFELIPFGAGRRICPGIRFASSSVELTVANLMHKFDWALPEGAKGGELDVTESLGMTIGKKKPLIAVPTKCYF